MPNYTRFFAPLALQAASQALTYPLVAMVASRGPGGPLNLAGLVQSNTLMYMLGTFGFGLVTAGMVFGRTRKGFHQFRAVTLSIGLLVTLVQGLVCVPQVSHLLFGRLIGLPPSIEHPAAMTLLATVPLQFLFFIRIPFQVAMYNARATGKASLATILRILLTAILSPLFCLGGCGRTPLGGGLSEFSRGPGGCGFRLAGQAVSGPSGGFCNGANEKGDLFVQSSPVHRGLSAFPVIHPYGSVHRTCRKSGTHAAGLLPGPWTCHVRLPMAPPGSWKWCSHSRRRLRRTAGPFDLLWPPEPSWACFP